MSANGYLHPYELTTVQGSMQLRNDTAAAWNAMKDTAALDGVTLTIARPEGDYRSWATQLDMRAHPGKYNITPGIIPGLPSEHGFGTCVDVASGLAWVKEHGEDFGFTFPLATDPNHARYDGITVPAGLDSTLITEEQKQETDDMALIRTKQHGYYTAAPGVVICHPDTAVLSGIEFRKWGTIMDIAPDDLAAYLFDLAGCPKDQIPAPGHVWSLAKA